MPLLCTKLDAKYWQGMHDIVSGMLLIEPQPPMERIFVILSAFLQIFLPFAFNDEEAVRLRHVLEMIRLLLQYHDPSRFCYTLFHDVLVCIVLMIGLYLYF